MVVAPARRPAYCLPDPVTQALWLICSRRHPSVAKRDALSGPAKRSTIPRRTQVEMSLIWRMLRYYCHSVL
jgi:hypothetical protein